MKVNNGLEGKDVIIFILQATYIAEGEGVIF